MTLRILNKYDPALAAACDIAETDIIGELGDVLNRRKKGRRSSRQITLYKSLGIVPQDLFAAELVYRCACEQGIGTLVDF